MLPEPRIRFQPRRFLRTFHGPAIPDSGARPMQAGLALLPLLPLLAILAILPAQQARAALGGTAESVQRDRVQMKAAVRAQAGAGYTLHELTTPAGIFVREYANADGRVFAVTWSS